jgi:DNA (cytosine-5)-methyltransferase 1
MRENLRSDLSRASTFMAAPKASSSPSFTSDSLKHKPDAPTAVSLFCGAGGLSIGFRAAGFRVAAAYDIDRAATQTYEAMLPGTHVETRDAHNVTASDIGTIAERVDILIGGPPCQGFSSAGAKWWDDPRNGLLRAYVALLADLRPTWFLMENVEGLLTANESRYVTEFVTHVIDLGYWVRLDKINLAHYGVPQRRKRVFVVGNLAEIEYTPPEPTHGESLDLLRSLLPPVALWDAISDLPEAAKKDEEVLFGGPPQNALQALMRGQARKTTHHFAPDIPERTLARIRSLGVGQDMRHLPAELQHDSYRRRAFRRVMDGTPTERRGGAPAGLQRLFADRPAKTITSASVTEFVHPFQDRPLTIRECARVQTFPDWFEFSGTPTSARSLLPRYPAADLHGPRSRSALNKGQPRRLLDLAVERAFARPGEH